MNLGQLRSAVEEVVGADSITDVVRHINDCLLSLAIRSNSIFTQDVTAVNGVFTIPVNVLSIEKIYCQGNDVKWQEIDPSILPGAGGNIAYSGYKTGATVILYPRINGDVTLYYKLRPAVLVNDGDTPELTDVKTVLINYAIWQVSQDEEWASSDKRRNNYLDAKEDWELLDKKSNSRKKKIRLV